VSVYATATMVTGRLDLEVVPGHPVTHRVEWHDDLALPAAPLVLHLADGEVTVPASLSGRTVTLELDATLTAAAVGRPWKLVDATDTPVLAGEVVRWTGPAHQVGGSVSVVPAGPDGAVVLVQPYTSVLPASLGIDVPGGLASYNRLLAGEKHIDPKAHFGAANDGVTDDSVALQAAVNAACALRKPLLLQGAYRHGQTLTWAHTQGRLHVDAYGATITYTGSLTAWTFDMDTGAANQPSVHFEGGNYVGNATAIACFWSRNLRLGAWDFVQVQDYTNGIAWWVENVGRWSERNSWIRPSARNCRQLFSFDCHEVAVTSKSISAGTATLEVGPHRFQVGHRVLVALDTPDPDYDSDLDLDYEGNDLTLTGVTSTTISYATAGADEAPVATTGTVTSKGSFKLTRVEWPTVSGGTPGFALIQCHRNAGPYDSFFGHLSGNVARGADVYKLSRTTWRGTTIIAPSVEVNGSTGVTRMFTYYTEGPPRGPMLVGAPHVRAGIIELTGTPPTTGRMFHADPAYGGISTADLIQSTAGFVDRVLQQGTFPLLTDLGTPNRPFGTRVLWEDNARGLFEYVARTTDGGMRGSPLWPRRVFFAAALPAAADYDRGDICILQATTFGGVGAYQCALEGGSLVWREIWRAGFVPTTPGDWDTAPSTVQAALDEIAARLRALEP
jgi:hypothetical protein